MILEFDYLEFGFRVEMGIYLIYVYVLNVQTVLFS